MASVRNSTIDTLVYDFSENLCCFSFFVTKLGGLDCLGKKRKSKF